VHGYPSVLAFFSRYAPTERRGQCDNRGVSEEPVRAHWRDLARLAGIDERELRAMCTRRRFGHGEVVFHAGDPAGSLFLIERGRVAVRVSSPLGEIATIEVLVPGDTFGEQSLVDGVGQRTATVAALEPVESLALGADKFRGLRDSHPGIDRFLVAVLSERLQRTSQRLLDALYLPAEARVARCLSQLVVLYESDGGVSIPLTQADLATMAGVTRSTANRILRDAERAGALAIRRGHIDVSDPAALRRRAAIS
jgi:CRP-like cAMP-binding protein